MQIKRKTKTSRTRKATAPQASSDLFTVLCRSDLGVECVKEYRFHSTRKWRFDFAIPRYKVAIEIDGGVWTYGRHNRAAGYIADMEKMNAAASLGWIVLKFTPQEQYNKTTFELLRKTINTIKNGRNLETNSTI